MLSYKNNRYLSLGFMADNALSTFQPNKLDPFAAQQELFEKSTGITDELFTRVTVKTAGHNNYDVFYDSEGTYGQYNYKPKDTTKPVPSNGITKCRRTAFCTPTQNRQCGKYAGKRRRLGALVQHQTPLHLLCRTL